MHCNWSLFFSTVHCICSPCKYLLHSWKFLVYKGLKFLDNRITSDSYLCWNLHHWYRSQIVLLISLTRTLGYIAGIFFFFWFIKNSIGSFQNFIFSNAGCLGNVVSFVGACCWIQCSLDIRTFWIIFGECFSPLIISYDISLFIFINIIVLICFHHDFPCLTAFAWPIYWLLLEIYSRFSRFVAGTIESTYLVMPLIGVIFYD